MRRPVVLKRKADLSVPSLSRIEAFRTSATSWRDVPWGRRSWDEPGVGVLRQTFDIDKPAGADPVGGRSAIIYLHANGGDKTVAPGGTVDTLVKQPWLTDGGIFIAGEFMHPVTNISAGPSHDDVGRLVQTVRALAPALGINPNRIYALCRSRGNLGFYQTVAPDLASQTAPTYAGRLSSRFNGLLCINPQVTYSVNGFCQQFIEPADHAAVLAENPDNPFWQDAIDLIPTANVLPNVAMIMEGTYFGGLISKATLDAWDAINGNSPVHFPDAARVTAAAYAARGMAGKIAHYDAETDNNEQYADAIKFFRYLEEGMDAAEAMAMARAYRKSAQAHYLAPDMSGVYVNHDGTGGTPPVGGQIGALVAGQYGRANRVLPSPLGYGMGQNNTSNRPLRDTTSAGTPCLLFADSTDRMSVPMPSGGTVDFVGFATTGEELTALSVVDTTRYVVGTTTWAGKKMILGVGSATTMSANDKKLYRNFARAYGGLA